MNDRVKAILADVKRLACEYYGLTGKPLGVTGEVAEFDAAEILGLELVAARTAAYDAIRRVGDSAERIQIKGRATSEAKPNQRLGRIKQTEGCDVVMLVLLDIKTLDAREIWEAPYPKVAECLARPGSKARNEKGALSVREFKSIGKLIWKRPVEARG